MANLTDIEVSQDVDIRSTFDSQRGAEAADIFAPKAVQAIAEGALGIFNEVRKNTAEGEAKSLLDEFAGKDLLTVAQRESNLLAKEEELLDSQSRAGAGPGEISRTKNELLGLETAKKNLERDRQGVIQGLLTNDEYRIRAERSFYQQVALSPGIKEELAKVMGEHFGFDPRGQTARITMDARKAKKEKADIARNKIKTELISRFFWEDTLTDEQNISKYWPVVAKQMQAQFHLQNLSKKLDTEVKIDSADKRIAGQQARTWMAQTEQLTLFDMGRFGNLNVFSMSPQEISNLTPDLRSKWVEHINTSFTETSGFVRSMALKTEQDFTGPLTTLQEQRDTLVNILNQTALNDVLKNDLDRLKAANDMTIQAEVSGILFRQEDAKFLAAYNDILNGSGLLANNLVAAEVLMEGLRGSRRNLKALDPVDKEATLKQYEVVLSGSQNLLRSGDKLDDRNIGNVGNVAAMITDQRPEDVDDKVRQRLFDIVADKAFMTRLEAVDPAQAARIKEGVILHQAVLGQNYNKEIEATIRANDASLKPEDFHIENTGEKDIGWAVKINTEMLPKLAPHRIGPAALAGQAEALNKVLAKKDKQAMEQKQLAIETHLNRRPKLIDNLVKSRAAASGVTAAEAAKLVARDIGMALSDSEPVQAPGFAESSGLVGNPNPGGPTLEDLQKQIEDLKKQLDAKE